MKLHNLLTKLIDRRPKIIVVLELPKEIINNGKYNRLSISTDEVEFNFTHGIVHKEYFFKGLVKLELGEEK